MQHRTCIWTLNGLGQLPPSARRVLVFRRLHSELRLSGPLRKDKCALDAASESAFYIAAPLRTSVVFWPSKRVVIASVQEREVLSRGRPCAVSIRSEMCLLSLSVCGGNAGVQAFSTLFSCEWEATELVLGCFGFCPPGRGRKGGVRIDDCALGSGVTSLCSLGLTQLVCTRAMDS